MGRSIYCSSEFVHRGICPWICLVPSDCFIWLNWAETFASWVCCKSYWACTNLWINFMWGSGEDWELGWKIEQFVVKASSACCYASHAGVDMIKTTLSKGFWWPQVVRCCTSTAHAGHRFLMVSLSPRLEISRVDSLVTNYYINYMPNSLVDWRINFMNLTLVSHIFFLNGGSTKPPIAMRGFTWTFHCASTSPTSPTWGTASVSCWQSPAAVVSAVKRNLLAASPWSWTSLGCASIGCPGQKIPVDVRGGRKGLIKTAGVGV